MTSFNPLRRSTRARSCRRGLPALVSAAVLAVGLPSAAAADQATDVPDARPGASRAAALPAMGPEARPSPDAAAQVPSPQAPRPREPMLRVRAAGAVGLVSFAAADTFKAVYGSSTGLTLGGAVQVVHRRGWFGQVDVSHYQATGERVFVSGTERFSLGIATRVTVTPIEITGGYRLVPRPRAPRGPSPTPPRRGAATPRRGSRFASLVPYAGAGVGVVRLTERGDFAEPGEDVEETHRSYHVVGGVEIPMRGWLRGGVEAGYRWVPNALGGGGVSQEFGETDLGGFVLRVKAVLGR